MLRHLLLLSALAGISTVVSPSTCTAAEQTVVLKDGRKITGTYDEAAGTVTTSGAVKAVIRVAKADVARVETVAAPATPATPIENGGHKQDPLAAIDQQIARKQQEKLEAENSAVDTRKRADLERASATKAENPERQKMYGERAQRFSDQATRSSQDATRLGTEIAELKRKRLEVEKDVVKDALLAATLKAADELTGKTTGDTDSPLYRFRKLDGEAKELQAQIKTAQDQLTQHQTELTKLQPQLDLAMVAGLDLKEFTFVERPNESDADKARRLSDHKTYNDAMLLLRQAKSELDSGKTPAVQGPLTTLRSDAMRRLHQEKTGRPLVFWDEALKALDAKK